jgi:triosephosphate isomerase
LAIDFLFGIAPQFIHLEKIIGFKKCIPNLLVGAQNCSEQKMGAYTGEVSSGALKDLGVDFVLIGHSERRQFQKETNQLLNKKIKMALKNKLKVVYCIGETLAERNAGQTENVLAQQLNFGLDGVLAGHENLIIAYEPVWAIGTGLSATAEQAETCHLFIRNWLASKYSKSSDFFILYGGSVKPDNAKQLMMQPNVDGALVGGASLKANDFIALCQ